MEITKLNVVFLVLHIVFSFFIDNLSYQKSRQLLLNCLYALSW
jgi:hypothetical protein